MMLFTFRNFFLQNVCADNWFIAADYSMMAKTGLVHILEVWHMGTFKVLMRKNSERLWYHYFVWITEKYWSIARLLLSISNSALDQKSNPPTRPLRLHVSYQFYFVIVIHTDKFSHCLFPGVPANEVIK